MSAPEVSVTAEDVERTVHATTVAQWGVASVVMVGSMIAGGLAVGELGESAVVGVITGGAVDLALSQWLRIGKRLRVHGVWSAAGWVLELVAAGMTLFLNLGAAVFKGINKDSVGAHWLLGVTHSFLPVLLILVTVAFGDAHLKLLRLQRQRQATQRAEEEAQRRQREEVELRRANGELVDAHAVFARAQEFREAAEREARTTEGVRQAAAQARSDAEAEVAATHMARVKLAEPRAATARVSRPRRRTPNQGPVSVEGRKQWVREVFAGTGQLPTGAEVDRQFGTTRSGHRIVAAVREEFAEEKHRALRAVGGGRS